MHFVLAAATAAEVQPTIDFLLNANAARRTAGGTNLPVPPDSLAAVDPTSAILAAAMLDTGARIPLTSAARSPHPHHVSIMITGVGSVATTWSLMRCCGSFRPDLVIQAGIAGCLTARALGETFAVRVDSFADLGVWENERFKSPFDLRLADPDEPPFSAGHLPNPHPYLLDLTGLEAVEAITVNEISTDPGRIRWLQQNSRAVVETMEGAALHYVCLRESIPFVQLRSVSNAIGVRDKSKWDIPGAVRNLNDHLTCLLKKLAGSDNAILQRSKDIPS